MKMLRKVTFVAFVFAMMLGAVSIYAQAEAPPCEGDYLESVRTIGLSFIESLNDGDLDPWYELLADDYELYTNGTFVPVDRDTSRADTEGFFTAFPGFQTEIHMSNVSSDCRFVTYAWTSSGTNDGPIAGLPATGAMGSVSGINIAEVADGKIIREWNSFDLFTLLAQLGLVTLESPNTGGESMISENAVMTFVERFDAIFDGPNVDIADEIFAPDFIGHAPLAPELNRQGWKDYVSSFYVGLPDITQEVHQVIIGEDRLVLHVTYTGTHTGVLFGVPPTGNPIIVEAIGIFRFDENGQVAENWAMLDIGGLLAQIGAFPPGT
ncbi:MAG: ester cyclase [Anaerolineae bacterium]|nr:ester cyclase [Anaerolineae bacterium]